MRAIFLLATVMLASRLANAEELPLPPVPPNGSQLADAAPVPNVNAQAPAVPLSEQPSVNVRLYRAKSYDSSAGFVPGSRYQSSEDRKAIQTPGFSVSVPLK